MHVFGHVRLLFGMECGEKDWGGEESVNGGGSCGRKRVFKRVFKCVTGRKGGVE